MTTAVVPPIDTQADSTAQRRAAWDRFGRAAVVSVLAATLAVYLAALPALAFRWARQPFLGAFVEPRLVFNAAGARQAQPWPAFAAGVQPLDQLLRVDGAPVASSAALSRALAQKQPGQSVRLTLLRPGVGQREVVVGLTRFSRRDFNLYFGVPYLVGLAYIGLGLVVFWLRRHEAAGRAFALGCACAAVVVGGLFDLYTTHLFAWAWTLAVPATGAALITLSLVFPREAGLVERRPGLRLLSFGPALALAAYGLYGQYGPAAGAWAAIGAWRFSFYYLGAGLAALLLAMAYRRLASRSPIEREQSGLILLGGLVAFAVLLGWVLQPLAGGRTLPLEARHTLPLLVVFPAAAAYALLRYRLLDTDYATTYLLVYGALAAFTLGAYALIVAGVSVVAGAAVNASHPAVLGLLVFVVVVAFDPLRDRLQTLVNDAFFRGTRAYRQRLEAFGRALTRAAALGDISRALQEQIEGALRPSHVHLFLRDPVSGDFAAYQESAAERAATGHGAPASARAGAPTEVRFAGDGALARTLARERAAHYLTPGAPLPPALAGDRARLAVVGSAVYAPLHGQQGLTGWLAIGPKLSGQPPSRDDLRFVEALADQSALAIERATVISDLERRVRELNVLSQMAQAVNFTLVYDDLLELIFAQASKVVDTRQFYIALKDERSQQLAYALYVENDERDFTQENQASAAAGRGLASDILRTGQPVRTDDYPAECRRRGVAPRVRPFTAWMGVPLNAGAETIGVMSVGSFEAGAAFTEDQLKIFWAIADQAASALVRARLYRKSEERARQLATLNELSTSMASSLALDPLLERIVQSSMDILRCEAGSLFLTDEETGESIFRVAAGPVGQNLVGMRIARGKGFVGEAIENGTVLTVNDVQNDPRWYKGADQSSGFVTRALMVVPLHRGERTLGALEVINKRDGSPFDEEDRTLLTAFAGQAAVAIQNARLFAQTDQALAARVEELSIMQRIDRELNEALDVQRVMDITLDWAMRITRAYAGSVGMVTEAGIQIIATFGYGDTVEQLRDRPLPLGRGIMGRVVRTGAMNLVRDVRADPDYRGILADTRCQLTIPIAREGQVVGLINLESPQPDAFSDEQVALVTRLLEHAAVAITNARLYAEVTAANIAKSEFVSVAAHELKTPMTAIKMSAELMLSGAVGGINDTQKQFLGTIKNNLDRMTTIVSDLNDITRIETGRLRLDVRAFPFQAALDEVLRATQGPIEAKGQVLRLEIEPGLPPVLADHNRTVQVLTNLLSNAHKYTPEKGEIWLRARLASGEGGAARLHISVQDTGIGIAEEDQRRLFTKFFRSEDRAAREMATGTGLGLSIVKNLVELQGGRIWLESELRKGSTFHFTVPVAG